MVSGLLYPAKPPLFFTVRVYIIYRPAIVLKDTTIFLNFIKNYQQLATFYTGSKPLLAQQTAFLFASRYL